MTHIVTIKADNVQAALRELADYLDDNNDCCLIGLWNMGGEGTDPLCDVQAVIEMDLST
jgi:hypothetical protein